MGNGGQNLDKTTNLIGERAAVLSAVEIGLGSLLHGLHVPLSGQILSLNQGFILSRLSRDLKKVSTYRFGPAAVSNISALFKSLSPAGKKLTPMLAISAQGLLFNLGTLLFGQNFVGVAAGATLLSLWAYLQPVLLYLLLYGKTAVDVVEYFGRQVSDLGWNIPWMYFLGTMVALKMFLAIVLALVALWLPDHLLVRYLDYLRAIKKPKPVSEEGRASQSASKLALKDLFNPLFVASLLLTFMFFILADSPKSQVIWGLLRPIAVGFALFYLVRVFPLEKVFSGEGRFHQATRLALAKIKAL